MKLDTAHSEPITTQKPLPPLAKGLPLLGSSLSMLSDPLRYFLRMFQNYGPIFRIRVPGREYTIMAGLEANQLMATADEVLSSTEVFADLKHELGTEKLLVAMDGSAHRTRRKLQRTSYSRDSYVARIPQLMSTSEAEFRKWQVGEKIPVFRTLQRIVVRQLSTVLLNRAPGDNFESVRTLIHMNMLVSITKLLPPLALKHPSYVQAKKLLLQDGHDIIAEHLHSNERLPDLVDALLAERDEEGNPLTEREIIAEMIGSYNAGMDTVAGTVSFMLYAILKSPDLLARLQPEIDALFVSGRLNVDSLKDMPTLHMTVLETLRLYPVAPLLPRTAAKDFEFAGHCVKAGTPLFLVNGLTHFLPEYFPDPERFDIHRHTPEARKSRPPNAFAPYSFGAHTCLGAALAETQVMVLIAHLLHNFELQLDPPDFTVHMYFRPVPTPGDKLQVRILRHRTKTSA